MANNKGKSFLFFDRSGRRSRPFFKEVVIARLLPAAVFCGVVLGTAWFVTSGEYLRVMERTKAEFIRRTVDMGFVVENLSVKGRKNLSPESVTAILNIQRGDPLFDFNPDTMRSQLEALSWVKNVRIERRLPDTVYIEITEREPLAFWQKDGKISLIDDEGKVLTSDKLGKYGDLLLVVGENANTNAAELIRNLNSVPDIAKRVVSATRLGDRRWDLILKNKITVRLPEKDISDAMSALEKMQAEDKLLDRAIVLVDLRVKGKMIIRPEAGADTLIQRPDFSDKEKENSI